MDEAKTLIIWLGFSTVKIPPLPALISLPPVLLEEVTEGSCAPSTPQGGASVELIWNSSGETVSIIYILNHLLKLVWTHGLYIWLITQYCFILLLKLFQLWPLSVGSWYNPHQCGLFFFKFLSICLLGAYDFIMSFHPKIKEIWGLRVGENRNSFEVSEPIIAMIFLYKKPTLSKWSVLSIFSPQKFPFSFNLQ